MKDRIKLIREKEKINRKVFEEKTGINRKTWENIEHGQQKVNEDHIKAIVEAFPEYAYWLTTGLTMPECGQISPEMEEVRKNLKTGT